MRPHGELQAAPGLRREGSGARAQGPLGALLLGVPETSILPRAGRMEPKEAATSPDSPPHFKIPAPVSLP